MFVRCPFSGWGVGSEEYVPEAHQSQDEEKTVRQGTLAVEIEKVESELSGSCTTQASGERRRRSRVVRGKLCQIRADSSLDLRIVPNANALNGRITGGDIEFIKKPISSFLVGSEDILAGVSIDKTDGMFEDPPRSRSHVVWYR